MKKRKNYKAKKKATNWEKTQKNRNNDEIKKKTR